MYEKKFKMQTGSWQSDRLTLKMRRPRPETLRTWVWSPAGDRQNKDKTRKEKSGYGHQRTTALTLKKKKKHQKKPVMKQCVFEKIPKCPKKGNIK